MSFICVIATSEYALMVGDGRMTNENGVLDEHYRKINKLNPQLLCGFAGNATMCDFTINQCFPDYPNVSTRINESFEALENACHLTNIRSGIITDYECFFLMAGMDDSNRISLRALDLRRHGDARSVTPTIVSPESQDGTQFMCSSTALIDGMTYFARTIRPGRLLLDCVQEMYSNIAAVDHTVNTNLYYESIGISLRSLPDLRIG